MKPIPEFTDENSDVASSSKEVATLRSSVAHMIGQTVQMSEQQEHPSFYDRTKAAFISLRTAADALSDNDRPAHNTDTFVALQQFFLDQLDRSPGKETFSFQNASNAIIRDTKNPRFHQELMAHFMAQEGTARESGDSKLLNLALQAKEFNAVQIRRAGEPMLKEDDSRPEGMEMMSEARTTLGMVLHEWELLQDLKSQARTLYELGYIATITNDYRSAADIQEKSANVADQVGEKVGAGIARIERCIALLRGKLETPEEIVPQLEKLLDGMRQLDAEVSDPRAKEWIANGLVHLSETREAAGDLAGALQCVKGALVPGLLKSNIGSKLGEYAKRRIPELEEKIGIPLEERWVALSE